MVPGYALKDPIYCQFIYWNHATSGENSKYCFVLFPFIFFYLLQHAVTHLKALM